MNIRTSVVLPRTLLLAAVALLPLAASAEPASGMPVGSSPSAPGATATPDPCSLLTPEQIKAVLGKPVDAGKPSATEDVKECTWKDAKGADRVYLSVKDAKEWKNFRDSMQATGKMTPVTGVAEDAFFVGSSGSSAAFYTLKKGHVVLLTVDGEGFSRAENQTSEKTLAPHILDRL